MLTIYSVDTNGQSPAGASVKQQVQEIMRFNTEAREAVEAADYKKVGLCLLHQRQSRRAIVENFRMPKSRYMKPVPLCQVVMCCCILACRVCATHFLT